MARSFSSCNFDSRSKGRGEIIAFCRDTATRTLLFWEKKELRSLTLMNNLFLYVDNHYIAAAIRDDNDVMKPVLPKTGDEFYSLFFFEDTDHNLISYGEANKPNYYKT